MVKETAQEVFVDSIGQIHFTGGLVRYDMVSLQPAGDGKNPEPVVKQRVIMPPQGFLSTYDTMTRLIDQLVEAGVLTRKEKK